MFTYTRFGNVYIPNGNNSEDVGTGGVNSSIVRTTDSYFDFRGNSLPAPRPFTIPVSRVLTGQDIIEFADPFRELRALEGSKARLWRTWLDTEAQEWRTATLLKIDSTRDMEDGDTLPIVMRYEVAGLTWNGAPWGKYAYPATSNDLYDPDFVADERRDNVFSLPSISPIVVTNEGNAIVREAIIDISVSLVTTPMTKFQIVNINAENAGFELDMAISAGQTVRVDTGKKTVKRIIGSPADVYANFAPLGANDLWLPIVPGENGLSVSLVSFVGTASMTVSYYDASI